MVTFIWIIASGFWGTTCEPKLQWDPLSKMMFPWSSMCLPILGGSNRPNRPFSCQELLAGAGKKLGGEKDLQSIALKKHCLLLQQFWIINDIQ